MTGPPRPGATMIAIITDITPSRATVAHILDAEEVRMGSPSDETLAELGTTREAGGVWWTLAEVDEDATVGQRIWRGAGR